MSIMPSLSIKYLSTNSFRKNIYKLIFRLHEWKRYTPFVNIFSDKEPIYFNMFHTVMLNWIVYNHNRCFIVIV
ncbi:hypothetical protein GIB67_017378 [Kingdonia uniflora]|uniref:Uncharacterized protein n=1 Tax=Kingdonia uniflora TaxID=39325 RepID=A0A7J7N3L5_9MAGN|nr:hypothetical protein GIB67_017378 [Kingdonia uniflora]